MGRKVFITRVLQSALRRMSPAREVKPASLLSGQANASVEDGNALLRRADALFDIGRYEEAEATYRSALLSDAPAEQVHQKLQQVVAIVARSYEKPGALLVPPGDGRATSPPPSEFNDMLEAVNRELATVPSVMPSKFWTTHANRHVELLTKFGLRNFKRTVAHNYYNWVTVSVTDKQVSRLLELWPVHGSSEALADEMEDPTTTEEAPLLREFASADAQRFYRLGVSLLWDYTLHTDNHGLLRKLAEPVTGNPLRITRRGRLLSQDLAHSVRERNLILDASGIAQDTGTPIVIGELGAGHGRLAHVFAMSSNCRYMIFDIAPALLVSQWYIQSLFPGEKIFRFRHFDHFDEVAEELSECRFAFFASSQLEKLPQKYFDLFINVCSLMEMRMDTINYFFRQIARVTRGHFYTKQSVVQTNREDDVVIERGDYPVPKSWISRFSGMDPINQRLFEELWEVR